MILFLMKHKNSQAAIVLPRICQLPVTQILQKNQFIGISSVVQSFWNFAQSMAVILPYSVQNSKND